MNQGSNEINIGPAYPNMTRLGAESLSGVDTRAPEPRYGVEGIT